MAEGGNVNAGDVTATGDDAVGISANSGSDVTADSVTAENRCNSVIVSQVGDQNHIVGAMSAGMLSAGRSVSVTEFARVTKVVANRRQSVIKLWSRGWNEVYADGPDFDFVENWIRTHVPETVEWIEKG